MEHSSKNSAVLSIAGSDSGGGAGIQADLRTFAAHGLFGCTAITAVTAQNTVGVRAFEGVSPALVEAQIAAVMEDLPVAAAKTGMLASSRIVEAVARAWAPYAHLPLVIDPVMVATSGDALLATSAVDALVDRLFPLASVLTPNIPEAEALLGRALGGDPSEAADELSRFAPRAAVVIKGGHAASPELASDWVRLPSGEAFWLHAPWIDTRSTHGTGCTFSAAIAARLALGDELEAAIRSAKRFISGALRHASPMGRGHGPVNHLWRLGIADEDRG